MKWQAVGVGAEIEDASIRQGCVYECAVIPCHHYAVSCCCPVVLVPLAVNGGR